MSIADHTLCKKTLEGIRAHEKCERVFEMDIPVEDHYPDWQRENFEASQRELLGLVKPSFEGKLVKVRY